MLMLVLVCYCKTFSRKFVVFCITNSLQPVFLTMFVSVTIILQSHSFGTKDCFIFSVPTLCAMQILETKLLPATMFLSSGTSVSVSVKC